jgi:sugar lactone lactonase YvrE
MSRFAKATISLLIIVMLFLPAAMAATVPSIDASQSQRIPLTSGSARGPESVAFDAQGDGPYSGVSDGRVLKWNGTVLDWQTYTFSPDYSSMACKTAKLTPATNPETLCGRPLGLQFRHKTGDLYVADAYKGLMRVGPDGGEATVLVNQIDGLPLRFTNGIDIDQITGQVYFTDSSMNYDRSQHEQVTNTHDSTGRLLVYDPQTTEVQTLQAGMAYPNGVAISPDRTHLVVASTGPCKLLRHWIKGSKAGNSEPFADLPGYPDNVRRDGKGGYWVALHGEKNERPLGADSHLLAVRVGSNGKIIEEMRGPKRVKPSEIMERKDGKLYIGTMDGPYVGVATRK